MIEHDTFTLQQEAGPAIAKASAGLGDLTHARADRAIIRPAGRVAPAFRSHTDQAAGAELGVSFVFHGPGRGTSP